MKQNYPSCRPVGFCLRTLSVILPGLLLFALQAGASTTVGGVISSGTTYTLAGSPYIVTNNLLVQQGVTLTVQPGVIIQFNTNIYLQVDGELRAVGTPTDSITFTASTPGLMNAWAGVRFTDICTDYDPVTGNGCRLDYCIYEGSGNISQNNTRTIKIGNCNVMIAHSDIRNCWGDGIIVDGTSGSVQLISNKIHNAGGIPVWAFNNSWGVIQGNDFYDCLAGGNPPIEIGKAIFIDNHVHGIIKNSVTIRVMDSVIIAGNIIEDGGTALLLQGGDGHIVKCNTFNHNKTNVGITCERHPLLLNNNFLNYVDWNIYWSFELYRGGFGSYGVCRLPTGSGTFATINLSNNYWGGITSTKMDTTIWDFSDDFSLKALISYAPMSSTPITFSPTNCAYSSAPVEVTGPATATNGSVEFFPNPFHDNAWLKIRGALLNEQYRISILDMSGKVVRQVAITRSDAVRISGEGLNPGMYFCQIISPDNQRYFTKIIVQ